MTTMRTIAGTRATASTWDRRLLGVRLALAAVLVLAVRSTVSVGRWVWTWLLSPDYPPAVSFSESRPPHSGDR